MNKNISSIKIEKEKAFLAEVKAMAEKAGIDFFIVTGNGLDEHRDVTEHSLNVYGAYCYNATRHQKFYDIYTFNHLFYYIEDAERDAEGMHYPFGKESNCYPNWAFHIYDNKRQLNICRIDGPDAAPEPVAIFIFQENGSSNLDMDVRLVRVTNGVADYEAENSEYLPVTTMIGNGSNWEGYFGEIGGAIKEVLRDALPNMMKD